MERDKNNNKIMLSTCIVLAVLCAAGTAVGTSGDLDITQALYSPDNIFWRIFTILGIYPFLALWVLYMGVICRQVRNSDMSVRKKKVWTVVCGYLALSTSTITSWALFAADTIGGVLPQTINNPPIIAAGALFGILPLFFLGFFTSKKEYDAELLRRLVILCIVMVISIYLLEMIKLCFSRPRYRLLIQDIPGVEFQPWYMPFAGSGELISSNSLDWNDFRSFPSGHALQSMGLVFALPPLAEVYSRLGRGKPVLFSAGAVFGILVCVSRMVMGAHFLSDVCIGSLMALLSAFVYFRLNAAGRRKIK